MIEFIDIHPEDGIKKLRVSCGTLKAIVSEAYVTENENKEDGYRTHAGIAHWVRVPICECGTCASLLADSRRAGRKMHPTSQALPIINCATALRMKDRARVAIDEDEEDRLLDIAEGSLVIHQCGNPKDCRITTAWKHPGNTHNEATKAMETYQLFRNYKPRAAMEVNTYSGSQYHLFYKDGVPWVIRDGSDGTRAEEELKGFYRMGDRMIINDWFTSSTVGSRMIFAVKDPKEAEREQGLIEEMRERASKVESPPEYQLVLDDIEKSIDSLEEALEEVA
jgi:hypothetical protein